MGAGGRTRSWIGQNSRRPHHTRFHDRNPNAVALPRIGRASGRVVGCAMKENYDCGSCFYGPYGKCSKPHRVPGDFNRGNCPDIDESDELERIHTTLLELGCDTIADDMKAGNVTLNQMRAWIVGRLDLPAWMGSFWICDQVNKL